MSPRGVIPFPTMLCDDQKLLDRVMAALRPIPWPTSRCVPAGRAVTTGTRKLAKKPDAKQIVIPWPETLCRPSGRTRTSKTAKSRTAKKKPAKGKRR